MKTNWFKRTLCSILALVLVLGYFPVQTIAAESDGLCEHHTQHTKECGYSPAVEAHDCGHVHTDDCYDTVTACVHVHEDCGYVPAVEGHGCDCQPDENGEIVHTEGCGYVEALAEVLCGHVCSAESGCVTRELVCPHAHDGSCGYIAPTPEQPCAYACTECAEPGEDPSESEEDPSEPSEPEVDEAVEAVRALIEPLPTLEEIKAMSTQEQSEVYTQVQKAYDAYDALTDDQNAQIPEAEGIFVSLFNYFNSLVTAIWDGAGSASSPYLINNEEDLRALAQSTYDGDTQANTYFTLTGNITLTETWTPIGTEATKFCGIFNGQGYTISGISGTGSYLGLFAYLGGGARVENVNVAAVNLSGGPYLAGIAAVADHTGGQIVIRNCHALSGTITGIDSDDTYLRYLAGIVGYGYVSGGTSLVIEKCTNSVYINAGDNSYWTGGIAGYVSSATITSCINYADVYGNAFSEDNGSSDFGGICGEAFGSTFAGCANYGAISTFFAHGIAGGSGNHYSNCLNGGTLTHSSDGYGDPIGRISNNSFDNCYFSKVGYNGGRLWNDPSKTGTKVGSLSDGSVAYDMGNYFGQVIGTDPYPVLLTASNKVHKVTIMGELKRTLYVTHNRQMNLTLEDPNLKLFLNDAEFSLSTPITKDLALTSKTVISVIASGECGNQGDNLTWQLTGDGVLTISGTGDMYNYSSFSSTPWYSHASRITSLVVTEGVTSIGGNAFRSSNLESVSFGNASLSLGNYSFAYCESLTSIDFGSGTIQPGEYVFKECTALTSVHVPQNVVMNGSYSGIGSGLAMFSLCSNLKTATLDCGYVGPFFFECCYAMTQATFTNKNVNFYCLEDNYGSTFRGSGSSNPMNVTVVGYLCSKANVLTQKTMPDCTLTFQQIAGDTTQHTETVLPGTATCTAAGLSEGKVCSRCGYVIVKQTNVDALGHKLTKVERQEPTCTDKGLLEHFHCSVCGKNFEDENGTTELNDASIPAEGHSLTKVDGSEPSCTEDGVMLHYHCSVCGKDFKDENGTTELTDTSIPAKGHSLSKVERVELTCTEDGVMLHYHCSVCGKDFEDENGTTELTDTSIPAKGHSLTKVERVEPTCTEDGVKLHYHCSVCDKDFEDANGAKEMTDTSIPTVEHEWGEWAVTTPATPEADGVETRKCTVCQQEETRPLTYTGNRLVLTGTELENQSTVWIDGVPVSIEKDDVGNSYVTLPENSSSILVTYSYNTGSGDRHTQYPTGMNVYRVEKTDSGMTVQHLPELQNLLQYSGCSIRITGNKGIRMITSVNQDTRNALTGNGLAGFKLLEYGTLLAQTSKLGNNPLVLGGANVKSNYAYKKDVADPVFKYTNGLIQYTNVLVGFTDEQCKEDIAMRPYMKLQDKNGEEFVIYGGIVYRSIGYIAYQNRNAFQPRSAAYEYVWSIIHNVYGNQYDSEYKK